MNGERITRCGTYTGYRQGCRCRACTDANTEHMREYRERTRPRELRRRAQRLMDDARALLREAEKLEARGPR